MKFTVTLKDPDGFSEGFREAAKSSAAQASGLDKDECEALEESRAKKIAEFAKAWVEDGEYVTLEFDNDFGTARVVKRNER